MGDVQLIDFYDLINYHLLLLCYLPRLDDQKRRQPPAPIPAHMVDWNHHHNGGKTTPSHRSDYFRSSFNEEERKAAGAQEKGYEDIILMANKLSVITRRDDEDDTELTRHRRYNNAISNGLRSSLHSSGDPNYESATDNDSLTAYRSNDSTSQYTQQPPHTQHTQNTQNTQNTQHTHAHTAVPPLSMSSLDIDVGSHSTVVQVPIPVPPLNRSISSQKSPGPLGPPSGPNSPRQTPNSPPRSPPRPHSPLRALSPPRPPQSPTGSQSPRGTHLTRTVPKSSSESLSDEIMSRFPARPVTPDSVRRKQIYENVLRNSYDSTNSLNESFGSAGSAGEFKHLEQLLGDAEDGTVEVQKLKAVMRTIMERRKQSLQLLQSSITSAN